MPTEYAIRQVLDRIDETRDIASLRELWGSLAYAYQAEPAILQAKDRRKLELEKMARA